MGNTQPTATPKTEDDETPKINHERFTNRQILKTGPQEQSILIKVAVPQQKEYTSWAQQLAKAGNQEALLLPKHHNFKKEGFCGLSGMVEIIYENYPFLLSDQINNRDGLGTKYFEENELWYLILTLLSAAEFFHSQKKKIGDVRPQNVFISADGSVKVACVISWPMERTNYEKSFQKNLTYISPEEVNEMGFGKTDPSTSFELSETFSIGLTLLDAATLSDSKDLYQKNFQFESLEYKLNVLQSKEQYSRLVKALIKNMCNASPQNRTSSRTLFDWLSPYQDEINNFEDFQPGDLPEKLKIQLDKNPQPKSNYQPTFTSNNYNNFNTYIGNSHAYHPGAQVTAPLQPVKVDYTYVPPLSKPAGSGSGIGSGIGFSYQSSGTTPPPLTYLSGSKGTNFTGVGVVDSTYVPFSNKFSLQKIDEQLEQSRKMFPS